MTTRHEGFVLVGRMFGDYYFIDSVFDNGDGLHGATGSIVRPVFTKEYEWASDKENVAERFGDCYSGMFRTDDDCKECNGEPDPDDGCKNCNIPSLDDWVDDAIRSDGIECLMFDSSDTCRASTKFDELGIKHECTDCSGGGRIFSRGMDFDTVYDNAILDVIIGIEDGAVSVEDAAKVIFG